MDMLQTIEKQIKEEIMEAVIRTQLAEEDDIPNIILEKPKNKEHGDYATNIAMQLTKIAKQAPRKTAEAIVNEINREKAGITNIEIAGPGFINISIDHSFLTKLVPTIIENGDTYGRSDKGQNHKIQVEFVSANPTGDLHLGHARGAAYGDALCNVLDYAGFQVEREYYINDAGNQIDNLARSVEARYMQALGKDWEIPEDGYHGKDVQKIGQQLAIEDGDKWVQVDEKERLKHFRKHGLKLELDKIKSDLAAFGVTFDNWFSETSLYEEDKITEALNQLQKTDLIYEEDGATWFESTAYHDDKDRVLVKSDGSYTYLTPDIAYHKNKLDRGFETLINIWGADHHGYIPRMKAAIQALGYEKDTLEVEVIQMVNLFENGEKVKMSKRTGKAVTLRQLMEEVGKDAMRYFFSMRSGDSHLDFDMDLARSQSTENPVFYVQYAHARICTMLKQAEEKGWFEDGAVDYSLLESEKEEELLRKLGEFPQVIREAAEKRIPHKVTQYVFDVSTLLHSYYNAEKVLDDEKPEQTKARLAFMKAVRITIANALRLIGVHAPEQM